MSKTVCGSLANVSHCKGSPSDVLLIKAENEIDDCGNVCTQLLPSGLPHNTDGQKQSQELEKSHQDGYGRNFISYSEGVDDRHESRPPIIRRLIICCILAGLGFRIALLGGDYLDDKRRLLGSMLCVIGFLLGGSSFVLLYVTFISRWT